MSRTRSATQTQLDAQLMRRALRESRKGRPSPNPHVGAVLARRDQIVTVGHHARCGGPHAEVVALDRAGRRARGATLYVTVEPCNHQGRTGPCTEAIIAAGVKRVVVGCADPTPPGRGGLRRLRSAGIEVLVGVEQAAAEESIADFRIHAAAGRPLTLLKAAVTLDGRIATRSGDSRWITGEAARREAHRLRAWSDAVLVGVGTVLADDPALTVRMTAGHNPLRVVLDSGLRTPIKSQLVQQARNIPTLVVHAPAAPAARRDRLQRCGVELKELRVDRQGRVSIRGALRELGRRGVLRLLVEGGASVHGALLDAGLADRAAIFVAPKLLADSQALPLARGRARKRIADAIELSEPKLRRFGQDLLWTGEIVRTRRP